MKCVRSKYHTEGSVSMKKNENKYTPYVKDGSGVANQIVTEKLEKKFAFSWFGFFLGPVYFFYRRCYAAGTVLLMISLAGSIAGSLGRHGEVLSLLGFLLGGFCFYPAYRLSICRKIKKQILPPAKGGTSTTAVWIMAAVAAAAFSVYVSGIAMFFTMFMGVR